MPSPFVHSILPATCLLSTCRQLTVKQTIRLVAVSVLLANSPDLDIIPALIFKDSYALIHRGAGHNLFSLIGLSILGAWLLRRAVGNIFSERKAIWLSMVLVSSHIFLDATAQHNIHGDSPCVPLFWPFSNRGYTIPFKVFDTLDFGIYSSVVSLPIHLIESGRFWREVLIGEMLPSLFLFCLFWIGFEFYQWTKLKDEPTFKGRFFKAKFFRANK